MVEPVDPRKSHPIPPPRNKPENLADRPLPLLASGYEVCEWHRLPNGEGKPEAIVLVLNLAGELDGASIHMAIKSRLEANRLIQVLERHRDSVWPVPLTVLTTKQPCTACNGTGIDPATAHLPYLEPEPMIVKIQISMTEPVRMLVYNRDRSYLVEDAVIPELADCKGWKGFAYARILERDENGVTVRELKHLGEAPWQDW